VARPEVAMRSDAWNRMKSMLAEFGLTPSSRSRVSATGKPSQGKLARFLEGG
jgi:P27 family predicted phage terminase small subunit